MITIIFQQILKKNPITLIINLRIFDNFFIHNLSIT